MARYVDLRQEMDPLRASAKESAFSLAKSGDSDALAALSQLGESTDQGNGMVMKKNLERCHAATQEASFEILSEAALQSGKATIVDMPSSYRPRGVRVVRSGRRYFGLDTPEVIDEFGPAAMGMMTDDQQGLATYAGVDITSYEAVRAALSNVSGEICIVTEGLLFYLRETHLRAAIDVIKRLLQEFGGCWISSDAAYVKMYAMTCSALLGSDPSSIEKRVKSGATGYLSVQTNGKDLFWSGPEETRRFIQERGFMVRAESAGDYLPDLDALHDDPKHMDDLRRALSSVEVWSMTLNEEAATLVTDAHASIHSKNLKGDLHLQGTRLRIELRGRLDTMSAPRLIDAYRKIEQAGVIEDIEIDAKDLEDISSNGLRALLIIYKKVNSLGHFHMYNMNEKILDLPNTTGMEALLELER